MLLSALATREEPSRLEHHINAELTPRQGGGITFGEHPHRLSRGGDRPVAQLDGLGERSHVRVVLQEVRHRCRVAEIVERDDLDVRAKRVLRAEEVPSDTAEAVDPHPECHGQFSLPSRLASACRV